MCVLCKQTYDVICRVLTMTFHAVKYIWLNLNIVNFEKFFSQCTFCSHPRNRRCADL